MGLNQVYAFETTDGRYGKLIVDYDDRWDSKTYDWDKCSMKCTYVLFRKQGDGVPPPSLTYTTNPASYTVGEEIPPNEPVLTGDGDPVDSYSIAPALPSGLVLNTLTGVISGTPTAAAAAQAYTITGENTAGTTISTVTIAVLAPPSGLSYTTPVSYPTGTAITDNVPTVTGDVDTYSVSPGLPSGLTLNAVSGVISGTPIQVTAAKDYTVTATNSAGGSTTAVVNIATPLGPPKDLSYSQSPATYPINTVIIPNTPTVTNQVTGWSINPALPAGLDFNTSTGIISGTPLAASGPTDYTVTATNSAGSTTVILAIETTS
jgi:hypothetical protein